MNLPAMLILLLLLTGTTFAFDEKDGNTVKKQINLLIQNMYFPHVFDGAKRFQEVDSFLNSSDFDFVFLQEVVLKSNLKMFSKEYYVIFEKGRFGPRGGLVTLSKEKPDSVEFYKFKKQGDLFGLQIFDRLLEKGFLVTRFGNKSYINVHLVYSYTDGKESQRDGALNAQFEQLYDFIKNELKNKREIIVAGDFNSERNSARFKKMSSILNEHTAGLNKSTPLQEREFDYVFSSNCSSLKKFIVNYSRFVSDHPGIGVSLRFN